MSLNKFESADLAIRRMGIDQQQRTSGQPLHTPLIPCLPDG